jgi:hypothetical protein
MQFLGVAQLVESIGIRRPRVRCIAQLIIHETLPPDSVTTFRASIELPAFISK